MSENSAAGVVVMGWVRVDPAARDAYVAGCVPVVEQARRTPGCLDFAISADPADPGRVDIAERWASRAAVEAFRGDGPSGEQQTAILAGSVVELDVTGERALF